MHHSPRYALLFPEDAVRTTGSGWNIWQKNWERCCESDLECLLLGREERVRLHELGRQLGSLDKKQETQIFLQYAEFLEEKRGGLLKEIQEKRRLCNLLGVTAGLFLTILIL